MKIIISVVLALVGVLALLATSGVVRGHLREVKGHLDHCKKMCSGGQGDVAATSETPCGGAGG